MKLALASPTHALRVVGAMYAEQNGLIHIRGDGTPEQAGLRLTDSGKLLAIALGYDPDSDDPVVQATALAGVVDEATKQFSPEAHRQLETAEAEVRRLNGEIAILNRQIGLSSSARDAARGRVKSARRR